MFEVNGVELGDILVADGTFHHVSDSAEVEIYISSPCYWLEVQLNFE